MLYRSRSAVDPNAMKLGTDPPFLLVIISDLLAEQKIKRKTPGRFTLCVDPLTVFVHVAKTVEPTCNRERHARHPSFRSTSHALCHIPHATEIL